MNIYGMQSILKPYIQLTGIRIYQEFSAVPNTELLVISGLVEEDNYYFQEFEDLLLILHASDRAWGFRQKYEMQDNKLDKDNYKCGKNISSSSNNFIKFNYIRKKQIKRFSM